jgi:3-oxoacyl-[acyl-carrier-protein] synthase II
MDGRSAVVTGIGIVSPIGTGKDRFWSALKAGATGIRPVSLFATTSFPCHQAGEISDFDAEPLLGKKGLKYLDRSTQLAASATALALEDAGLADRARDRQIGLVLGTTFGSIESISGFDRQILKEGPRSINPMGFPRTVINSPAGHVAIRYGLNGPNTTMSAGSASSLQAIAYAADFIQWGRAEVVLAGGVEELAESSYSGFCSTNLLSSASGDCPERAAPFDANRNGFSLGEGAAVFVIESADHAAERGVTVHARVLGGGVTYTPSPGDVSGAVQVMRRALADAELDAAAIGCICASANGSRTGDDVEARSIAAMFGGGGRAFPIYSIKSMIGETLGAAGAFQVASAVMALDEGVVPPTVNFSAGDPACPLDGVTAVPQTTQAWAAIINAFGADGIRACLVVGRGEPRAGGR